MTDYLHYYLSVIHISSKYSDVTANTLPRPFKTLKQEKTFYNVKDLLNSKTTKLNEQSLMINQSQKGA